ncbi:hypothetical protein ACFLY5_01065 [Patescibacteria group bacterium]
MKQFIKKGERRKMMNEKTTITLGQLPLIIVALIVGIAITYELLVRNPSIAVNVSPIEEVMKIKERTKELALLEEQLAEKGVDIVLDSDLNTIEAISFLKKINENSDLQSAIKRITDKGAIVYLCYKFEVKGLGRHVFVSVDIRTSPEAVTEWLNQ